LDASAALAPVAAAARSKRDKASRGINPLP
jgi:hypothetical protein